MLMSNISPQTQPYLSEWQMPVVKNSYPDCAPLLSDEEKLLMEQYVTSPATYMTGSRARNVLHKLERFNRPFLDTVNLTPHNRQTVTAGRRHLFTHMVRTGTAFWAWSKSVWIEVIEAAPVGTKSSGTRFWMINLAYLFCDFLYVGASTTYGLMASTLFGSALVEAEIEKLRTPAADIGYWGGWDRFHWLCALCMLINRHPSSERFSAQTMVTVSHLLPEVMSTGRKAGRQMLKRLQTSLCQLGILDEPAVLPASDKPEVSAPVTWRKDSTVDPKWIAWICAFYEQTPYQHERTIRTMCNFLMLAGRWLKETHPEITEPTQWDETIATEYVAYTCRARRGDQALPSNTKYTYFQDAPQQLSPGGIESRLRAMRSFFSHLQRRPYTVNGKRYPKLQLDWLPRETFKIPEDILAARQPNPRDIAEDLWFKLIWAACTLTKEKLHAINRNPQYPLAYYRAACLIWVTAARRSDEIRRLGLGCVRREWAPEMRDEHGQSLEPAEELFYLRIPTNKMKGEFYIPIPSYVADAIEVWESVRPPNQAPLPDRKTRKPTNYLFQYRNELMGEKFLNNHAIPLLCQLAGVSQADVVGRITSHRARATTATWMRKMGMSPTDIGKLLGHTNPTKSLPWYLREDKHRLGRAYRKANPLERYVAAILDTNAHARQEPCVFYYLSDGPDGRPRMCGNPHFSRCIHQLMCVECEAFIDHEQAEAIEKRDGAVLISVPIPLPPQMVAELNEQDEAGSNAQSKLEALPPPVLPGPAFHFNKAVPLRSATNETEDLHIQLARVEAQIAKKQRKVDRRSASMRALLQEQAEVKACLEAQETEE